MVWDTKRRESWVKKRTKDYGMVEIRKTTRTALKALKLTEQESYDAIIRRLIQEHSTPKRPRYFDNPEDKD